MNFRLARDQFLNDLHVPLPGRDEDRRLAGVFRLVDIGSRVQELADQVQGAFLRGHIQRCAPLLGGGIEVGVTADQLRDHFRLMGHHGKEKERLAMPVHLLDLRAGLQ